jgi:hypothetical protein
MQNRQEILPTLQQNKRGTNQRYFVRSNFVPHLFCADAEGGSPLIAKGICWSTAQNPTINDNKTVNRLSGTNITHSTTDVTDNVNFTATLTGLLPQTTYYLRIYGTNSYGTSYSSQISFRTEGSDTTLTDIEGNVYRTV